METIRSLRSVRLLLLLLVTLAVAVVAWAILTSPTPAVRGQSPGLTPPPTLSKTLVEPEVPFNTRDVGEDQDEIDPEACATVVQKELEGPIVITNPIFEPFKSDPVFATSGVTGNVIREQMIIKIIQTCNVDDPIRPPNLERELDTDIEIFSIICEKAVDLSTTARCEILRIAQEDNAPFLQSGSGSPAGEVEGGSLAGESEAP